MHLSAGSTRSLDRRLSALKQANEVRIARAKLKQDLREGKVRLAEILTAEPEYVSTAQVRDLILAVPKIGPAKAARMLSTVRVSQSKSVGSLSDRQRAHLVELLSRY